MQFGGALGRAEHGGRIHVQLGAISVREVTAGDVMVELSAKLAFRCLLRLGESDIKYCILKGQALFGVYE
jgi:hypothetical protein